MSVCFFARATIRLILPLVVFIGFAAVAQAQMCGTFGIKIFVIDESGKSVKDVAIGFNPGVLGINQRKLERDENDPGLFVLTMLEGDVDSKKYELDVSASGFVPFSAYLKHTMFSGTGATSSRSGSASISAVR